MGCKQTTVKSPSLVFATSPTAPNTPIYIKSALKTPQANGRGKNVKLSSSKRKQPALSKSVNFDEKVRVKLRTPTPKETRYENSFATDNGTRKTFNNEEENEDDDQLSSISSQEDIRNEHIKTSTTTSNPSLQRNQANGFWYKNNSIAVVPSTNNIKEKSQQPIVNTPTYPTENLGLPTGNRFLVRRKPQTPNSVDPNQSSAPIQRPLSNTNAVLLEHRTPYSNDGSSPQTAYYAFSRRPNDKTSPTEK